MSDITIYTISTNQINYSITCPEDHISLQILEVGQAYIQGNYSNKTHYILSEVATLRPTQTITVNKTTLTADGVDKITFTGAVSGSTITAEGLLPGNTATGTCGNPDYFSTVIADTYQVTVSCWPYLDFTITITAS